MTQFPKCLEQVKCPCNEVYCLSYTFKCEISTIRCGKCKEGLCMLCYSHCGYCNLVLCYNCYDHYDNNFCFKTWYKHIENLTFRLFNKYNQLDLNLKDYILSYINNESF